MYKILRDGKRFNTKSFETYEEARSYIRKWIRKNMKEWNNLFSLKGKSNPAISDDGFSIWKI